MRLLILIYFCLFSNITHGITYSYEGLITESSGIYGGLNGAKLTGDFTFHTDWELISEGFRNDRFYRAIGSEKYGISLNFFDVNFNSLNYADDWSHKINIGDNFIPTSGPLLDQFNIGLAGSQPLGFAFYIDLQSTENSLDAIPSLDIPTTLDLAKFDQHTIGFFQKTDSQGFAEGEIHFQVTALTAVPLTGAVWFFISALVGLTGFKFKK